MLSTTSIAESPQHGKERMMNTNVLHELAAFLEAVPYQVLAWDHKVIDYLSRNSETFQKFQKGCADTKWGIYSKIKYDIAN